jgi:hypothetical protein
MLTPQMPLKREGIGLKPFRKFNQPGFGNALYKFQDYGKIWNRIP